MSDPNPYEGKVLTFLETIAKQTKPVIPTVPTPPPGGSSEKNALKHVLDCPDCYPTLKQEVINREFKNKDYNCVGCGLPVGKEGLETKWDCPGCGERHVTKRTD